MFTTHPSRQITLGMFPANRLILEIVFLHSLCLLLGTQLSEISLLESMGRSGPLGPNLAENVNFLPNM